MNENRKAADQETRVIGISKRSRQILLLLGLTLIAVQMLRSSLAFVLRPIDPALALRFDSRNSEVETSRAEQIIRADPSLANRALGEQLARGALARSPVDAAAARMIAITRDLAGDAAQARQLMAYSESLSRRDLPVQLWFIEDAVRHDDVRAALSHYDIALRGSVTTAPLLFPVLIAAVAQPEVVARLIDVLAAKPLWADGFLVRASQEATDYGGLARLMTGLARRGYELPDPALQISTTRLVGEARYDLAWQIYAADRHDVAPFRVRDPNFLQSSGRATPFDWSILGGNGVSAEQRSYGNINRLAYSAATGSGGVVARQLLLLPSGEFDISGNSFNVLPGSPPAQLLMKCASSGRALGAILTTSGEGGTFKGQFVVPRGCVAQWLEILVDGGEGPAGAAGEIASLRVNPVAAKIRP